ncbi:hypothetical protein ACFX19_006132 [Malus domestica]
MVLRFGRWEILREVRVVGSSPSSGNDSTISSSSHSEKLTAKCLREVSVCRPHRIRFAISFLQLQISSDRNLDGNPPSGNDSNSGDSNMNKDLIDGREICISSGSDLNLLHPLISIFFKLGACSPPPWGKPTNSGHSIIFKSSRGGNLDSSGNDLNSLHPSMDRD